MRNALVAALVSCADSPHRSQAHRFVQGLSSDELQFIAGFLGACMLDSGREVIARYQRDSSARRPHLTDDREHKMILLLEYLRWTGIPRVPLQLN